MPFSNIKKAYSPIWKYLAQLFCVSPFQIFKKKHKYKSQNTCHSTLVISFSKKHTYESQNTWRSFLIVPFSNIKKRILTNLKIQGRNFLFIPFSNIKIAYLQIRKCLGQLLCLSLFLNIKKAYLRISEHPTQFPFSNIKKSRLMNLKIFGTVFFCIPFSNI